MFGEGISPEHLTPSTWPVCCCDDRWSSHPTG